MQMSKPVASSDRFFLCRNKKRRRSVLASVELIEGPRMMGMVEAPQNSGNQTRTNKRLLVRAAGVPWYCKDPTKCSLAKATTHGTISLCNSTPGMESHDFLT